MDLITVKKVNRNQVYQLVYQKKKLSKPEISNALNISMPTVSQCIQELTQLGLVTNDGFFESNGGRKAAVIACRPDLKLAIGVDVQKESIHIVAINLYGEITASQKHEILFQNDEFYCARVGNLIINFFIGLNIPSDALLGVGISIQGLVDNEGDHIIFGPIPGSDGFSANDIGKYLPFSSRPILRHDTEAAAAYALWQHSRIKDAFFLVLNRNLGGTMILNRQIHRGLTRPSGLIAHMTLYPGGRPCYCGKKGCTEAYCSARSLIDGFNETFDTFFEKLRAGDDRHKQRWEEYLQYLSQAIYNFQILMNTEILLSGELAPYLTDDDLARLTQYTIDKMGILQELPKITVIGPTNAAPGAALPFVTQFLQEYMQNPNTLPDQKE